MSSKKQLARKITEEIEDANLECFRVLETLEDEIQENAINKLKHMANRVQMIVHDSKESLDDSMLALGYRLNEMLAKLEKNLLNALDD